MSIGTPTGACRKREPGRGASGAWVVAGLAVLAGPAAASSQTLNEIARRQVPPVTRASPSSSWIAALVQPVIARKAPDVAAPRAAVLEPSAPYSYSKSKSTSSFGFPFPGPIACVLRYRTSRFCASYRNDSVMSPVIRAVTFPCPS